VTLVTKRKYAHVASNAAKINDVNNLFTSLGRDILETVFGLGVGDVFILRIYSVESRDGTPAEGAPAEGAPTEGAPAEGAPAEGYFKYNSRGCIFGLF
jgi:hypothetical protein